VTIMSDCSWGCGDTQTHAQHTAILRISALTWAPECRLGSAAGPAPHGPGASSTSCRHMKTHTQHQRYLLQTASKKQGNCRGGAGCSDLADCRLPPALSATAWPLMFLRGKLVVNEGEGRTRKGRTRTRCRFPMCAGPQTAWGNIALTSQGCPSCHPRSRRRHLWRSLHQHNRGYRAEGDE
jgi:hypothetical protein